MNLTELIQQLANQGKIEFPVVPGTVKAVDESNRTIDVEPLDGSAPFLDVRLQAGESTEGVCVIPAVDSLVLIALISKTKAYCVSTTKADKVLIDSPETIINGGSNDGLIIHSKLATEIAKLNTNFDILKNAVSAAPVVPTDGGASFKAFLIGALNGLQTADLSGIKNDKVKH